MSSTGKDWKICRYLATSMYNLDGIPSRIRAQKHSEQEEEAGTGQRRMINLGVTNIYWTIDFRIKLQTLVNYINAYCMITAEGSLPSHNLFVFDGIKMKGYTSCLVDTCDIEIGQRGAVTADITAITATNEDKALTVTNPSATPLTKADLTALSIGGFSITKWTSVRFGVGNNIARVPTGTGDAVSEIYARHPVYRGRIAFVKTLETPMFDFDTTKKKTIIITLGGKTYTFTNAAFNENSYEVEELDLTYENITWTGDQMAIT